MHNSSSGPKPSAPQQAAAKSSELNTLMSCKKILESKEFDNEQKLNKLVSDTELIGTIRTLLSEGEVSRSHPEPD